MFEQTPSGLWRLSTCTHEWLSIEAIPEENRYDEEGELVVPELIAGASNPAGRGWRIPRDGRAHYSRGSGALRVREMVRTRPVLHRYALGGGPWFLQGLAPAEERCRAGGGRRLARLTAVSRRLSSTSRTAPVDWVLTGES